GRVVPPNQRGVYGSIEGLIHHFELIMTNRQWQTPVEEVYAATESPNGELGFYVVADGSGTAYRARTRPPSFIHFQMFPYLIQGHQLSDIVAGFGSFNIISPERRRWGGQDGGRKRGGRRARPSAGPALSQQAGGDAARVAHDAGRVALRPPRRHPRDRRPARPEPGGGPRHDEFLRHLPRRAAQARGEAAVGVSRPGLRPDGRRGGAG